MRGIALVTLVTLAALVTLACGGSAAFEERLIDPIGRAPLALERVALPGGAKARAAWASPTGGGLVALRSGRVVALDAAGHARLLEAFPGEAARADDQPVLAFAERAPGDAMALVPGGALVVDRGYLRRLALPAMLRAPRAFAPLGDGVLWATAAGLFAGARGAWLSVSREASLMDDVTALAPGASPQEVWVQEGRTLRRLLFGATAAPSAAWLEAAPGVDLGDVLGIARVSGDRVAVASSRGVFLVGRDAVRQVRAEPGAPPPDAIGGGGGAAWVVWDGKILRSNGDGWDALARDVAPGAARIAVEASTGASALVVDAAGDVLRVDAEEALRLGGLADAARVVDTRLDLEALEARATAYADVAYFLDGRPLAERRAAPWGWGEAGARSRDLREIELGPHVVEVRARTRRGGDFRRTVRFEYASPFGRVPSYAADIAPLFAARCARCHESGVARDLASYERLRAMGPMVRAAVREQRMPPDLLLDPASVALLTAWVDGDGPP